MLRLVALIFLAVLLSSSPLPAGSHPWRDGELVSRKTIPVGRNAFRYKYVYHLRGSEARYVVVSDQPLKVDLLVPVKFLPEGRHLIIQDADGRECRVALIGRSRIVSGQLR